MTFPVVIIGGGLAGLTAARLIHQLGIDFRLLEARAVLGGRVLSVDSFGQPSADGFDLGASWYWPAMQPGIHGLVQELRLPTFTQESEGDVIFQRMSREAPRRYKAQSALYESQRLVGGTGALIAALAVSIPAKSVQLGARVTRAVLQDRRVVLEYTTEAGATQTIEAFQAIFALPPRLLEATVSFSPTVEPAITQRWRETPTWMAPHAKFFAFYERPFWKEAGLSGTAQSMAGPLVEIHDATTYSGQAALFGFLGPTAEQRARIEKEKLISAALAQLASLFGEEARMPTATLLKDWANDQLTATAEDRLAIGALSSPQSWVTGPWQSYMILAGSETSRTEPGYLAGAVNAAREAVDELKGRLEGDA